MAFLAFGSFWFWAIFVVASVLILIAAEKGSGVGATATLIVTMALLFFFGNGVSFGNFFQYCISHPWLTMGTILCYFVFGICWAILKWYFFLIKKRDEVIDEKPTYIYIPQVKQHKSEITIWMVYWPYSAIWTLLDVPIKRAYLFVYHRIAGALQNMANKIYAPLMEQQKKKEEEVESRRCGRRI